MSYKIEYKQGNNIKRLVRKEGKNTEWPADPANRRGLSAKLLSPNRAHDLECLDAGI